MPTNKEKITRVSGEPVSGGLPDQGFSEIRLEEMLEEKREKLVDSINRMKMIEKNPRVRFEDE